MVVWYQYQCCAASSLFRDRVAKWATAESRPVARFTLYHHSRLEVLLCFIRFTGTLQAKFKNFRDFLSRLLFSNMALLRGKRFLCSKDSRII
jgi:hypothetical protein